MEQWSLFEEVSCPDSRRSDEEKQAVLNAKMSCALTCMCVTHGQNMRTKRKVVEYTKSDLNQA